MGFVRCGDESAFVPVDIRTVGELIAIVKTNGAGDHCARRESALMSKLPNIIED